MSDTKYAVFSPPKRTRIESLFSNIVFVTMFAFLVYISQGSTWWTFVSGSMFLFILYGKIAAIVKKDMHKFTTKAELQAWVDGLDGQSNDS